MDYLKIKILVVEDNLQDYIIFREVLGQIHDFFIHIEHAENVTDAIELLNNNEFDFVFLDLFLPDSRGRETFTSVVPFVGQAPIVVLSGLSDKSISLDIVKLGAQDYIVKGEFDATHLEKSIIYSIERKNYQRKLEQSEKKFRSTFQSVGVAISEYDYSKLKKYLDKLKEQGVTDYKKHINLSIDNVMDIRSLLSLIQINPAGLKLFKCENVEEFENNIDSFYTEESLPYIEQLVQAVWEGKSFYEREADYRTKSGERICTCEQVKLLGNDLGYYRMLNSTSDITNLKQKEKEVLFQSHILKGISKSTAHLLQNTGIEDALQSVLETVGGMLSVEGVSIVQFEKDEKELFYRFRNHWFRNHKIEDSSLDKFPVSDLGEGMEALISKLSSGQCITLNTQDSLKYKTHGPMDGLPRQILFAPILEAGNLRGSLNMIRTGNDQNWSDYEKSMLLTVAGQIGTALSRNEARDELQALNENLEQMVKNRTKKMQDAIKDLEGFSYSISHDLRAPLRAISGFTHVLEESYGQSLDDEGREYLGHVISGANQMSQLIDDLLDFSRTGRRKLEGSSVDMGILVEEVVGELTASVPDRNLNITVESLSDCGGDRAMIKQVLVNFIWNSIKYTAREACAQITIGSRELPAEVEYFVKDNGVGFDMKYANKLFGVFQRLHPGEEFEGTGVGLAIVHRIVSRHGGRVWAEAKVDEGASFFFTFPKSLKNLETELYMNESSEGLKTS